MNRPRADCKEPAVNVLFPLQKRSYGDQYGKKPSGHNKLFYQATVDDPFEVNWFRYGKKPNHAETCRY